MTYFTRLQISEWQQLRAIDIEFHERLTIITGANASGKTTILNLLGRHSGWDVPSLSVPRRSSIDGFIAFIVGMFAGQEKSENEIGTLHYSSGGKAHLRLPSTSAASYMIQIDRLEQVPCFFLPSHRSVYRYQRIDQIPGGRLGRQEAYERVWQSTRGRYFGGGDNPASYHMKEILVHWSIFGRGNPDMLPDSELLELYTGFQDILRIVLPASLGFKRFSIRNSEIVLECDSGDFMIDAASGGLSTLIDLAWQVFLFPRADRDGFCVLIDEIENHLHPTMQRRILGDLLKAFPSARFIVTTHSPLVVSSVRDSSVFALRHERQKTIKSERLDLVNQAKTAAQILDEVLGVSTTIPIWAERDLQDAVRVFLEQGELTEAGFARLRERLATMGLSSHFPLALGQVLESQE